MEIRQATEKAIRRENLAEAEMISVMDQIMSGGATAAQIAAFLTALRMKGETVEEITGAARVMREKANRVCVKAALVVDTCGTGGDQKGTFNVSTTTAFVVAGAGVTVAKHGNRSVSSKSGSADVLSALGVKVDASKEKVEECLERIGIGFLFAPLLHEAMKHAIQPRREIGIRTIFNLLGPLTNPAGATHQLIGVYDGGLTEPIARVLKNLGLVRAMVVHGTDGLDEISLTSATRISELSDGEVKSYEFVPESLGFARCRIEDLAGGSAEECAAIVRDVLSGERGPKRDMVLINSAAALYVAGAAASLEKGASLAAASVDSGKAKEKLDLLIRMTHESGGSS
jgi:anthranilate phosphoribosyltransferase